MSPLRDLARSKNLTLGQVGVRSAYVIACGRRRAGPGAIQRMAEALGVSQAEVKAACDAAWNSKQGLPASNPAPVDPGASSEVHAADPSAAVPA